MIRPFCTLAALLCSAATALAQPFNNGCATATSIGLGTPAAVGTTTGATNDGPTACANIGADVWYRWLAPAGTGLVSLDTCGSSFDTVLAVYATGTCPVTQAQQIACDDDGATCGAQPFRQSRVTFTPTAGTTYLIRVGGFAGATGNVVLNLASCTPQILSTSGGGQFCGTFFHTLSVSASGGSLSYQWFRNGALETDATTPSIDVPLSSSATFFCRVSNSCGTVDSPPIVVNVNQTPTIITNPPTTLQVCPGQPLELSVAATGDNSYQWRRNTQAIQGATSPGLSISVSSADIGSYDCVISNPCGTITSTACTVSVQDQIRVTSSTPDQTICEGDRVTLNVTWTGRPATVTWRDSNNVILVSTVGDLTSQVTVSGLSESTRITAEVTGNCGQASLASTLINVMPRTRITQHPSSTTICYGQSGSISMAATGTNLTYHWTLGGNRLEDGPLPGGTVLSGTHSSTLTFSNAGFDGVGDYRCVVNGTCRGENGTFPAFVTLGGPVLTVQAGTEYPTIQSAIDALPTCGKVLVTPGTYHEHINLAGKRVWLESTGGPGVTTIDGDGTTGPFASVISAGDTTENAAGTVIKGFRITGGRGTLLEGLQAGGGIFISMPASTSNRPVIENCVIEGNQANYGGGLLVGGGSIAIRNTIFRNNQAAVGATNGHAFGGAISAGSRVLADRCTFENNRAVGGPGGLLGFGGVMDLDAPLFLGRSQLTNCVLVGNTASIAAGVRCSGGEIDIVNCTLTGNNVAGGSTVSGGSPTSFTIANSILWGNGAGVVGEGSSIGMNRCDLQPGTPFVGQNNLSVDPLFVSATDFRLRPGSPCIDAGDNARLDVAFTLDRAGGARVLDDPSAPDTGVHPGVSGLIDLGAYERSGTPSNACADAPELLAGTHTFSTVGATTDGPNEAGICSGSGDTNVNQDVWFRYTATCSGPTTFSLCGSDFDTKIGVYPGGACPSTPGSVIACNDDSACGLPSSVTVQASAGQAFLVRLGGYLDAIGAATLTISCSNACAVDFNNDGDLNADDLSDYITCYFSTPACGQAEFNQDGDVNADDLSDFITAYFTGC